MTENINSALGIAPQIGPTAPVNVLEERAVNAACRYREGYIHARAINGFGATIKGIAFVVAGLLALGGISAYNDNSNSFGKVGEIGGIALIIAGLLLGGFVYILGFLIQSAGQSMKAHFDCAVNTSPFLNDAQRAKVMSLE